MARIATMALETGQGGHEPRKADRPAAADDPNASAPASTLQERADAAVDELERRKARARRTAWIVAAIAAAFFVASLIQGHLAGIPNWVPPH